MPMIAKEAKVPSRRAAFDHGGRRTRRNLLLGVLTGVAVASLAVAVLFGSGILGSRSVHGGAAIATSADAGAQPARASVPDAANADASASSGSAAAPAVPEVPVAILSEPVDAAVFIDDDLIGTAPTKAQLAVGRTVRIRAELPGHSPAETSYLVVDHPDTVRLSLAPLAVGSAGRPTRTKPRGGEPTRHPDAGVPQAPEQFDPERLGQ